jgi:purine-nucleoside phosphorylase
VNLPDPDTSSAGPDPAALAERAAAALAQRTGVPSHDVAVVLGSGWGAAVDILGSPAAEVPLPDLPGFATATVTGHAGTARSVTVGRQRVLVFLGRTHLYEGRGVAAVAHPVRTAAAAGCRQVVLTNGCGGLDPSWPPGTVVLLRDHLNLTGRSPLVGATFVDLTEAYSPRLRAIAHEVDPSLPEGVYAQLPGPQYETPAEIRMLGVLGADLVGMSTALETVAARAAGLEVLGLSLVTNAAAGLSGQPLDHAEVLAQGRAAADRLGHLLAGLLERM